MHETFDNVTTADSRIARIATDIVNWEFTEAYVIGGHLAAINISRILYAGHNQSQRIQSTISKFIPTTN